MRIREAPLRKVPEIALFDDGLKDETRAFPRGEH